MSSKYPLTILYRCLNQSLSLEDTANKKHQISLIVGHWVEKKQWIRSKIL